MQIHQNCVIALNFYKAVGKTNVVQSYGLHLAPCKHYARFIGVLDKIFVVRLFIGGDGIGFFHSFYYNISYR
jgi:hypothetical protein